MKFRMFLAASTAVVGTVASSAAPPVTAATTDLLISEYVEGSSFNKALEIYNGTGAPVDLSAYELELYSNGATSPSQAVALSGTVADGDVFVAAHPSAAAEILAASDIQSGSVINWNGDDVVVLRKGGAVVDAFGQIGGDPASAEVTLRRAPDVCAGDTDPNDAFDASTEYVSFPRDTFDGLGSHTANCDGDGGGGDDGGDAPQIVVSEIMYNPASAEDDWEWVEIANTGDAPVDLAGWVIDDINGVAHGTANIASGSVPAGGSAVLYNADDLTATDFVAAWGSDLELVAVTNWTAMALNNGGDTVSLWSDFASYSGDHTTHANAVVTVAYDDSGSWPADDGAASIHVVDLAADGNDGANWALSTIGGATPVNDGYQSAAEGGNSGGDVGSPSATPPVVVDDPAVVINEFSASTASTDVEFVELFGPAGTDTSTLTVLEIEGDADSTPGVVDEVLAAPALDADGFGLLDLAADTLENDTITLLLVDGFTGAAGDDLDTDDDGVLDVAPWTSILDAVAVNAGDAGALTYGDPALGPNFDGLSSFAPGGASRIPDGADTDTAADWVRNPFGGTPVAGEAYNTPGAPNEVFVPSTVGECGDPADLISAIQGSGAASPLVDQSVIVEAVVVGDFQDGDADDDDVFDPDLDGFFLQEQDADADGDATTSEGVFVDDGSSPAVDVEAGQLVRVSGTASEYFGMTQVSADAVVVCGPVDAPTPATISLPVDSFDDYETIEGMSVVSTQPLYISEYFNFDRFGEIVLTPERLYQPTAVYEPGSPEAAALVESNRLSRLTLDDGRSSQNPDPARHPNGDPFTLENRFRGGDVLTDVVGVLNYSFDLYRIQPTDGATYTSVNERPASPPEVGGDLTVASFNVLNYFNTIDDGSESGCGPDGDLECRGADDENERERQLAKIVAAMDAMDADVVGIIEVENTAGVEAMADIVDALNDIEGAGTYAYVDTGTIGGDAIKVGFIYQPGSVTPVGEFAVLDTDEFVAPNTDDPKNRPALAQTFMSNADGAVFTVVNNHLKSKGSECGDGDDDPEAGSCNLTRTLAAQELVEWLAGDPTGSGDADVLIIGDLNSYDEEDPIDVVTEAGYTDLEARFGGELAYSYVFDSQLGYLDYGLANEALLPQVTGAAAWHINADEPDLLDYDTSFKGPNQDLIYAPDPYRASDHDPVLVGLDLTVPNSAPVCSAAMPSEELLWPPNHQWVDVEILGVTDADGEAPTIEITSIFQDEPVDSIGDGFTRLDGRGVGTSVAQVRAERSVVRNGRVYHIGFTATDAAGAACDGTVQVSAPLVKRWPAVDDGARYDSTVRASGPWWLRFVY